MSRILVVEDDKTMNKLVSTYLRDNGYYDFRMEIEYLRHYSKPYGRKQK